MIETKDLILIFLGAIAGLMHAIAFYKYHKQVILGISHPPRATWLLWVFVSTLNFFSYFVLGENWRLAILPGISTGACVLVFILFVRKNKLSKLRSWDNIVLVLGIIALLVWSWYRFNKMGAIYTNCILQLSVIASFIPIYSRFFQGREEERGPLPWFIFSGAYILQLIVVFVEWEGVYMVFYPINCFFLHLIVGILALKNLKKNQKPERRF